MYRQWCHFAAHTNYTLISAYDPTCLLEFLFPSSVSLQVNTHTHTAKRDEITKYFTLIVINAAPCANNTSHP